MLLVKIGVGLKLSFPHGHLKGQSQHGIDFREEVGGVEFGVFNDVPQVFNVFPMMFPITSHFISYVLPKAKCS
jgi:hypothetical protein